MCAGRIFAQDTAIDSLYALLKKTTSDTVKVELLDELITAIEDEKEWLPLNRQVIILAQKNLRRNITEHERQIYYNALADAYSNYAFLYETKGNLDSVMYFRTKEVQIDEFITDSTKIAVGLNDLGSTYHEIGNYAKALELFQKAIKIQLLKNDSLNLAKTYNSIGLVYKRQKENALALMYYSKSLTIREKLKNDLWIAESLVNIGAIQKDTLQARLFYHKAINYLKRTIYIGPLGSAYNNLGFSFNGVTEKDSALFYLRTGLFLRLKTINNKHIASSYLNIGGVFTANNLLDSALYYTQRAENMIALAGSLEVEVSIYKQLKEIYKRKGDFKTAFKYGELYARLQDSVAKVDNGKEFYRQRIKFEYEQKELVLKEQEAKKELEFNEKTKKQKIVIASSVFILFIVLLFSYFLYKRYRLTTKQKQIIEEQKSEVDIKNKEITDSINYASTIQQSLLPPKELKYKLFPNAFVLFQPKDIVSGDFYWFGEKNGKRIIAAIDCTGHGVPGSLMSMIGNNFLNELIEQKGITSPAEILNQLKFKIINALKQSETTRSRDGMDVAMLSFNANNSCVDFAGANNPLWVIRNNEVIEYNGDKQPVGFFVQAHKDFTDHNIELEKGDVLYIFTDGYVDQFGGPKGKKFKYATLKTLLLSISNRPVEEQETILSQTFTDWKGTNEQVDDVLLIGIKI